MESIKIALENIAADNGHICGSLYYIRSKITSNHEDVNELRENGGIKVLVKCLKQVNPKVLSLALSILGYCSMNDACREQLFQYGVIKDLGFIMKNINVDSINNRTCRMIANLAVSQTFIPVMYKHHIPSIIVNILSNTKCDETRYSAIRALRKIWENSSKNACSEMLKCRAVEAVSKFLTSKCKEIVLAVLRAEVSFLSNTVNSKHQTNNEIIVTQILGKNPAANINTINILMNLLPEQPLVINVIYSLCKIPQARNHLDTCHMMVHIIDVLKEKNNYHLTLAMLFLLECPFNRIRFGNTECGISILLDLISGTDDTYKELAINTLFQFQFCKGILEKMVKKGLIPILIKILSSYIQPQKLTNPCPIDMKDKVVVRQKLDSLSYISSIYSVGSSGMSPTICSTSWTPPQDDNIDTDLYSPCYSPVCESFDNELINDDESKSDVSNYEIEDDKRTEISTPGKLINGYIILQLLSFLIYVENVVRIMAAKDMWEVLLDCIQYSEDGCVNYNAIKILIIIIADKLNFKNMLTDGFLISTHKRLCRPVHELHLCKFCEIRNKYGMDIIRKATTAFESQFAETVMISMIDPDTSAVVQSFKILTSVTVPLVIRQPKQLITMLCRYKVYDNLCNIIRDDQNESFNDAVGALIYLFKTLNITYTKSKSKQCKDKNCHKNIIKRETTVTLLLDDGTLINTNKSFLSLKSPMFEAMFRCGGFKEAYEKTIRLNDVSSECFKSFLLLLEGYCNCLLPKDIELVLELIMITDKYMLNELSQKIVDDTLNPPSLDNCSVVYEWVKETGYQLKMGSNLGLEIVKFLLSSNSQFPIRVENIKQISRSNYVDNFIEDLSSILNLGLASICGDDIRAKFYLSKFPNN